MADEGPLHPNSLFGHTQDSGHFHVPRHPGKQHKHDEYFGGHLPLPQPLAKPRLDEHGKPILDHHGHVADFEPIIQINSDVEMLDEIIEPFELRLTKFMVIEVVVALVVTVLFVRLAKRMSQSERPRGRMWNLLEAMLLFIRDQVARPAIGKHDADRFVPFLWTMFFFILGCNLSGMIPWLGSPTGALAVTGAMALITFAVVLISGMAKLGVVGFWKAQVPHMELPLVLAIPLVPMIFVIEVIGLCIKHFVLAIRLLANMMAGHIVLAVIVGFIAFTHTSNVWYGVVPASVFGAVALSLLELFVAFLQAYIFTFLSALFIGAAVHPH